MNEETSVPKESNLKRKSSVDSKKSLKQVLIPQLNAFQGASLIVGAIIGSGIFTTPGYVLGALKSSGNALILWAIGAIVSFLGAMSYAEWGSRVTSSGAEAPYLEAVYKKPQSLVAILFTWVRVILVNPGYNANQAYQVGKYLLAAIPNLDLTEKKKSWISIAVAFGILVLQTAVCIPSNKMSGNFSLIVTMLSITCVLLVVVTGFVLLGNGIELKEPSNSFSYPNVFTNAELGIGAWAMATYRVMWAFDGWPNLASSLGELKNPKKNIFRSTVLGIGTVMFLYMFANVALMSGLPFEKLAKYKDLVPIEWGKAVYGKYGGNIMAGLICICLMSCGFVVMFSGSRIGQAAGESGLILFPDFFAKINRRFGTPVNALLANTVLSTIVLSLAIITEDPFTFMIDMVSYPNWIFYVLTLSGLLHIKRKEGTFFNFCRPPNDKLSVRVPFVAPLIVILFGLFLIVFPFSEADWLPYLLGLVIVVLGFVPYYFLCWFPKGLTWLPKNFKDFIMPITGRQQKL
ncbi:hypothetical protein HMI56_000245 [Coelomomyces lativittatus]|nr:hypothetical protein HMI56_000245 [Coelomomyces lativittatus]